MFMCNSARAARAAWAIIGLLSSTAAWSADASCQLQYPIVLSHMWSAGPICEKPDVTGAKSCENMQDFARYCVEKSTGPDGAAKCLAWRVPDDEADLPPRDRNAHDPTLVRDTRNLHRYFSKAIVTRLRDTCGNPVYIADKPPFASHSVRARALRSTVLQALRETGASKVNLIGMSMGVQDARYMTAALPVDDAYPDGPKMNTKVASLVSLVGEDGGAESAGIGLASIALTANGDWTKLPAREDVPLILDMISQTSWKREGQPLDAPGMLIEHCQGPLECDLGHETDRYRWLLRSIINLSPVFMRPSSTALVAMKPAGYDSMRQFVSEPDQAWRDSVPPELETNNGMHYMAYGAVLRFPNPTWGNLDIFLAVTLFGGQNDSNVSLKRQLFANTAGNFETVKIMRGTPFTTGYHHTFFSGRNDAMYGPTKANEKEPAPYGGTSADFYHQVARDLKVRGF